MTNYTFAIRKIKKRNGETICVPMAKPISKIKMFNLLPEFSRIIKFYDSYELVTDFLDRDFGLTEKDCLEHIEGFQLQQEEAFGHEVETVEMIFEEELQLKLARA